MVLKFLFEKSQITTTESYCQWLLFLCLFFQWNQACNSCEVVFWSNWKWQFLWFCVFQRWLHQQVKTKIKQFGFNYTYSRVLLVLLQGDGCKDHSPLSKGGHGRGLLFFYRRNYSSQISALQINRLQKFLWGLC